MSRYSRDGARLLFSSRAHIEPGHIAGYITTAILPASSPVKRVDGQWKPTKKASEASACLEAIKQLHKVWFVLEYLTQRLLDCPLHVCKSCSL